MTFLRFSRQNESHMGHEWGFNVDDGCIPLVGDMVSLWYALPDTESDDVLEVVIVKREFYFGNEGTEVFIQFSCEDVVPEGYTADSTEWPSMEFSLRKRKHSEDLKSIRRGRIPS